MRVGPQPIIARPAWYDRNPIQQVDYYTGQTVAPHGVTIRCTYTVPAQKKAIVESLQVNLVRRATATTAGVAGAYAMLTPNGGTAEEILDSHIFANTIGDKDGQAQQGALTLLEGDKLDLKTYDGSTGGTVDYFVAFKLTEFDA